MTFGPLTAGRELNLAIVVLAIAATLVAGCSRQNGHSSPSPTSGDTLANGLQRADVPRLLPWITMWRAAIPRLEADSLRLEGLAPSLRGGYAQPAKDFDSLSKEEAAAFAVLMARSPDGRYRLMFDRYQSISEENGALEIGGEPDSSPLLIDERLGLAYRLDFCGTPCGYDWGCWLDSVRFALGGWSQTGSKGDSLRGDLSIYSLAESTESRYFTRPVSSSEYARYMDAWRAWVAERHRAWRSRTAERGS